jgi:hypothetical protein
MDETLHGGSATAGLAAFAAASAAYLSGVVAGDYRALSDADVLAELRERESLMRRQAAADHALLAEIDQRGIAGRLSLPSTAAMLQALLLLSPSAAKWRVDDSVTRGPRVAMSGEPMAALLPLVAAGQASGAVSVEQARTIAKVLERLPGTVGRCDFEAAERQLVEAAGSLRPRELGQAGERILAHLDPDGTLNSDAEHQRHRNLTLASNSDGSYQLRGRLTPGCGALLQAWLSPHSAPVPASDGAGDCRSHGQRMHDALHELAGMAVRRHELTGSGAPAQVIITIPADQLAGRRGLVATSFGQLLTVDAALRLADEAGLTFLLQNAKGAVLAEGRSRRTASRAQTMALIARDRGCSFPDCDKPPEWTQRHHVRAWADGGPTDLDNLTLLCGPHHRGFETAGWRCVMEDRLPCWIPPPWIDPEQKPRQNHRIRHR